MVQQHRYAEGTLLQVPDANEKTALWHACRLQTAAVATELLLHGALVNGLDEYSKEP